MPGNTQRQESTSADATQRCPDESILLAYTRQQLTIEQYEEVGQHIQQCEYGCKQKFNADVLISNKLSVLAAVQDIPRYPDLWPSLQLRIGQAQQWSFSTRIARGLLQAEVAVTSIACDLCEAVLVLVRYLKPRKKLSFVSLPMAFALALILIVILVALAFSHYRDVLPFVGSGGMTNGGSVNTTSVVSHHLPPTPMPFSTHRAVATVGPSATGSATPTSTGTPTAIRILKPCSTPKDLEQHMLRICGTDFAPGDKIVLIIVLKGLPPMQHRPPVQVDAQGTFTVTLNVSSCRDLPIAIYAQDVTKNLGSSNVLQHIPFEGCAVSGKGA